MGAPITWRNVEAANPGLAARPMETATNTVNGAFDIFSKLIQQRQAVDASNVAAVDEGAKQAYLDRLSQAKTPEEVAALQASGQLDTMRQGLTAAARAAVRGADEARVTSVRQNTDATNIFNDKLLTRAEAPLLAQHATLLANGDIKGAAAFQAANAGQVRDWSAAIQKQYDTSRTRTTNQQADDLAALTNPNAIAAARQVAATQAQRDALGVQALNIQGNTQLAQEQAASDAQGTRALETRLAVAAQENATRADALGKEQGKVAQGLGLPVDVSGRPAFDLWTPEQEKTFNLFAKKLGFPNSAAGSTGDTQRGDALTKRLAAEGGISPSILRANEQAIRNSVSSVPAAPTGNDLVNVLTAAAKNTVAFDRIDSNNAYTAGTDGAIKAYQGISGRIPELLADNTSGFGKEKDIVHIQSLLTDVARSGIEIVNPATKQKMRVVPSVYDMESFIRSSKGGIIFNAARASDIKEKLVAWMSTPEGLKRIQEGEQSNLFRDTQRARQILRDSLSPPKK